MPLLPGLESATASLALSFMASIGGQTRFVLSRNPSRLDCDGLIHVLRDMHLERLGSIVNRGRGVQGGRGTRLSDHTRWWYGVECRWEWFFACRPLRTLVPSTCHFTRAPVIHSADSTTTTDSDSTCWTRRKAEHSGKSRENARVRLQCRTRAMAIGHTLPYETEQYVQ